ncbi:large ribosomal subunit protein bL9-like [Ylistrum balloti]|uniref:large ribosomal subunit protein bL9-like n=1 Tax=Ylistrum balloti TaxID=509963 RepID=UPI002905EF40|nr:large ribosomal subunit protein bL9-like [Ylistrum balloti]
MKVLLIESIEHLGLPGDIVDVKPGYARNYLLPHRKALKATEHNVVELEHKRRIANNRRKQLLNDLRVRCETLTSVTVSFVERVTDQGKLYGSVTSRRIADQLSNQYGDVPVSWVKLEETIKTPGSYVVELHLAPELITSITVEVIAEDEPTLAPTEISDSSADLDEQPTDSVDTLNSAESEIASLESEAE